ncbi:quercetin 2,3-dioxygenase [Tenacibaculum sp. 190524A05c]
MDRKKFLKNSLLAGFFTAFVPKLSSTNTNNPEKINNQIGFNHIPNMEIKTMKTVLHKANTRGHANHGWLDSHHSFSFANYYNPERMNFGVLRVLNDDIVQGGKGFGTHPHRDMEIISIPLEGDLEHKDSMGNNAVIKQGDVQAMSAGKGIYHSEFNKNQETDVKFLQIWIVPNQQNVTPRYDQISIKDLATKNSFYQVLSPNPDDQGVWIHQNAWMYLGDFDSNSNTTYTINDKKNGVYAFVLDGEVEIEGQSLEKRDGFGLWDIERFNLTSKTNSKVLLIEVPMDLKI